MKKILICDIIEHYSFTFTIIKDGYFKRRHYAKKYDRLWEKCLY